MRTVAIILSIVIALNVVYGNEEDLRKYRKFYTDCSRKFNLPSSEVRIDTALCAAHQSKFLDPTGAYYPEMSKDAIKLLIYADPEKLEKAMEIYNKCDKEATLSKEVGIWKSMMFLACGLDLIKLIGHFIEP
ncbi:uncharacterized protein LOC116853081 [Odontomachus brunneus]|uniref:uncharacterized protein LOC116853081 n=1 Tax=Odontomachus brunneus TaxID=486640 RepID=UPI0013F1A941|nr:uncharacterized protein LOC116853081 [Odontomachus brunneus]